MKKAVVIIIGILILLFAGRFVMNMQMAKMMKRPITAPVVEVAEPKEVAITEKTDIVGRVEAKYTTNIVSRVSGFLNERYFKEGDFVKKGQLLFKIQPDDYITTVNQAKASLDSTKASLIAAEKNLHRVSELVKKDYISKSEYDNALANRDSLHANLNMQKAVLNKAQLDLGYTNIIAPVSGKIGSVNINRGNYINQNSGVLATVVSLNPIYVSFNMNSNDFLKAKKNKKLSVNLILPDGSVYPQKGKVDFFNNIVNQSTGTLKLRATFKNENNLLLPGQFVNVKVFEDKIINKLTIPQEAIVVNPGGKFVYVLDEENKAQIRPVTTGLQMGEDIVIEEGLSSKDVVIIKGLQKVRPNVKVSVLKSKANEEVK